MIGKYSAELFLAGITAIKSQAGTEGNKAGEIFKRIAAHPVKVFASFITAPILVLRVAFRVKNKARRILAVAGLLMSLLASYVCATFLGTLLGSLFVMQNIGIIAGVGVFFGLASSVYLSVFFSILSFNAVSFLFLKISTQEVVDYLEELSK